MLEQRRQLPAWQERDNILDTLERSQVLVVSGMTGWVTQLGLFLFFTETSGTPELFKAFEKLFDTV